ncbi:PilN family type IVB pilus formation outer membrane protein [Burkholderia oklahomensis]|uniref:PilN family type IVB pilus formation outer membrane protein n=2 Tax=Burkholderia oklahomensis TaxID=342113 RepID=UPI0005DA3AFF|nr:PilN family type IVB pilus formation outer membrane protein [Burkholderia oklahomensis]AJX35435.1 type IVB pilus formation outer membrane protein, R64 PilN family [Burkholderia oklahomensis C6786]AOI48613.1 secretin [Burkholderia oklahomensis C6786]KUY47400.1 secretin [Burkholderia oklahomensis C6786]MBI0363210.1 PilN family type IVB pilus formation outer membrane protein [Burkholderia oklahomensis]SUY27322.1 Bundle-forming pilus B [Burkholderia oklahomensis]
MRVFLAMSLLAVALLSGCTGLKGGIERDVRRDSTESGALLQRTAAGDNNVHALSPVVVDGGLWVSAGGVKLQSGEQLPALFDEPASFDRSVSSLSEFAEQIARLAQVPTQVAASAMQAAARAQRGGGADGAARGAPAFLNAAGERSVPPLPPGMPGGASSGGGKPGGGAGADGGGAGTSFAPVRILYTGGTLRGLLDAACARFGVFWKYEQGTIRFFFTDTRTFQVNAIPGDSSLNASVVSGATSDGASGGSQSGGAGGGASSGATSGATSLTANNSANTAVNSQLSVFNGLQGAIQSMLSRYGSSVASPATGSISVTDTPDVLERVAAFMAQQNRALSRQVLLNVTVLSVSLSAGDAYGIDWSLVYHTLSAKFGIVNAFKPVSLTPTAELSATVLSPTSRFNGTSLLIRALSQQGQVRRKTSASVMTLNNQPVPVQVATQVGYLASVSTTNTANVGSSTALTPGSVTTGFNMTLLPHVLDDGTVMLQFSTNISSLLALKNVASSTGGGAMQIQTPDIDMRNFLQRVAMKSGETLVISGYEGTNDSLDERGVGAPKMIALGGGYEAQRAREVIVILITPVTQRGGA